MSTLSRGAKGLWMNCKLSKSLDPSLLASSPPPGSRNVRRGDPIEGPGGRWIPCATEVSRGLYYSGLFQVGPGQKQVCVPQYATCCAEQALRQAIDLAISAASWPDTKRPRALCWILAPNRAFGLCAEAVISQFVKNFLSIVNFRSKLKR